MAGTDVVVRVGYGSVPYNVSVVCYVILVHYRRACCLDAARPVGDRTGDGAVPGSLCDARECRVGVAPDPSGWAREAPGMREAERSAEGERKQADGDPARPRKTLR